MSKKITTLLAAVAVGCFAISVSALCPEEDKTAGKTVQRVSADATTGNAPCGAKLTSEKAPCSKSAATTVAYAADSKIEAILAALPSIKYQVGDDVTCCPHAAAAMAKTAGKPIQYLIGDTVLKSEGEAKVQLTTLLDKELSALTSLRYTVGGDCVGCPVTAKSMAKKANKTIAYRVGGFDFADKAKAETVAKLVATAADDVKMTYDVSGKSFGCDKMAGSRSKETGKPMTFVIGDEKTPCGTSAKLMLTQAKIRAIVAAAAAALAS